MFITSNLPIRVYFKIIENCTLINVESYGRDLQNIEQNYMENVATKIFSN